MCWLLREPPCLDMLRRGYRQKECRCRGGGAPPLIRGSPVSALDSALVGGVFRDLLYGALDSARVRETLRAHLEGSHLVLFDSVRIGGG